MTQTFGTISQLNVYFISRIVKSSIFNIGGNIGENTNANVQRSVIADAHDELRIIYKIILISK